MMRCPCRAPSNSSRTINITILLQIQNRMNQSIDPHPPNPVKVNQNQNQIAFSQTQLSALAEDRESVIIDREPTDSRPLASNEGSRVDFNSAQYAALVNSQMIRVPEQRVEGEQMAITRQSVQPVTHKEKSSPSRPPSAIPLSSASQPHFQPQLLVPSPYLSPPHNGTTVIQRNNSVNFNIPGQREVRTPVYTQTGNIVFQEGQGVGRREFEQGYGRREIENRVSPASRNTSAPTVVHFNYLINGNTGNIAPQPHPQPQPKPQPLPIVQPQRIVPQQIVLNPNPEMVRLQQQILFWQQRYFTVIERYQFHYMRFQSITREYIVIQQKVQKCKDLTELQQLKKRMAELQVIITQTEQEMVEMVNRNKEVVGDTTNWKLKYQELLQQHKEIPSHNQNQIQPSPQLVHKLELLQKQLITVGADYKKTLKEKEEATAQMEIQRDQIKKLKMEMDNYEHSSFSSGLQLKQMRETLLGREQQIMTLRMIVQAQKSANSSEQLRASQILITTLRQQKQQIYKSLKQKVQELQNLRRANEVKMGEYQSVMQKKELQIRNYEKIMHQNQIIIQKINQTVILEAQIQRLREELKVKKEKEMTDVKLNGIKLQEMEDRFKMILSSKQITITSYEEKIAVFQADLNKKDALIRGLKDKILQLEQQLKLKSSNQRNDMSASTQKGSQQMQKSIYQLKQRVRELSSKNQQLQDQLGEYKRMGIEHRDALTASKHEIVSLKTQLKQVKDKLFLAERYGKESETAVNQNTTELQEKIIYIEKITREMELKNVQIQERSGELQKANRMNVELKDFIEGLKQAIKSKDKDILKYTSRIQELQNIERENNRIRAPQVAQLIEQKELLQAAVSKKDSEISRLKQSNQLLQTNVEQLELQVQKLMSKRGSLDRQAENERNDLKQKIYLLQSKCSDYQRKVASLQQVRGIIQQQLTTLTGQLQVKIQNSQRIQLQLRQERNRAKTFETEIESHLRQAEEIRVKMKESEKKSISLIRELQGQLQKKKEELSTKNSQLTLATNRMTELQAAARTRENHMKQLQRINQSLSLKIGGLDNNLQEMKYLKHKIAEYEAKVSALAFKPSTRLSNIESTQVFERKVIYQLKIQNQYLKQQLNLTNKPTNDGEPKKEVRERLTDFNQKLESVIGEQFALDQVNSGHSEMYKKYERDRRLLIQNYNEEITQLKMRILQLQSQPNEFRYTSTKILSPENVYNEQIQFYREKNLQLQERVDNHIKVNKDLKESIQRLMKGHGEQHSIIYYKQQYERTNELNLSLQQKLKKANSQIRKLKEQLAKVSSFKNTDGSEWQVRINELNRKISQLVLQINQLQKEKSDKTELISSFELQLQRLRAQGEEWRFGKDQALKQLRIKEDQYSEQLAKLNNRIKLQQSEIQRLNELTSKKQSVESNQLKTLRLKLSESYEESRKIKVRIEEYLLKEEQYLREITKLENQNQLVQSEVFRLKEGADSVSRKNREYQTQILSLKGLVSDYQNRLRSKDASVSDFAYKQTQYQQQIARLKSQCAFFAQQIERLNEFTQKKISEKDSQIQRLKMIIDQRNQNISLLQQQNGQLKIHVMKSSEISQQIMILEQEINRLKAALLVKSNQYDKRLQEISELNGRYRLSEDQIKELRKAAQNKANQYSSRILGLEGQLKDALKVKDSASQESFSIISKLEMQLKESQRLREYEVGQQANTIYLLQSRIRELQQRLNRVSQEHNNTLNIQGGYEQQMRRKDKQYLILTANINKLEVQLSEYKITIQQLNTTIRNLEFTLNQTREQKDIEISELRNSLILLQRELQEKEERVREMNNMLIHIRQLEEQMNSMTNQYNQEHGQYQSAIFTLRQQIRGFTERNNQLSEEINKYKSMIVSLEEQLRMKSEKQRADYGRFSSTIANLEGQIKTLNQRLIQYRNDCARYEQTIASLEQRILKLTDERNSKYNQDISHYKSIISSLQDQINTLNDRFRAECSRYQSNISGLEEQIRILNEKISHHRVQCSRYESTIAILQNELRELRTSMHGSQGDLLHLRQAIMRLEGELVEVRRQVTLKEQENIELHQRWQASQQQVVFYQSELNKIRELIQRLQRQTKELQSKNKSLIVNSSYTIEFLRSVLIALQTLLSEQDAAFSSVEHAQQAQIGLGLEECAKWKESIV